MIGGSFDRVRIGCRHRGGGRRALHRGNVFILVVIDLNKRRIVEEFALSFVCMWWLVLVCLVAIA